MSADQPGGPGRRLFFAGRNVGQAVLAASRQLGIPAEELAYQARDKRHGFVKATRRVVIEVDPEHPRKAPAAAGGGGAAAAGGGGPRPAAPPRREGRPAPHAGAAPRAEAEAGRHAQRRSRAPEPEPPSPRREPPPSDAEPAPPRPEPPPAGREPGAPRREPPAGGEPAAPRREPPPERRPDAASAASRSTPPAAPSPPASEAAGPLADAAREAVGKLLGLAGLPPGGRVLAGPDRLEVDLSGPSEATLLDYDGELLFAIEHLLPRVIRGLAGEPAMVRVDCASFQEIRERRLRELARSVAAEVRRRGQPRTLAELGPAERRIVHLELAEDPEVTTESEGEGFLKRITVRPARRPGDAGRID